MNSDLHLWQVAQVTVLIRGGPISSFVFLFLMATMGRVFWSFSPKSNDSHGFGLWHCEDRSERLWIYELSKRLRENGESEKMKWEKEERGESNGWGGVVFFFNVYNYLVGWVGWLPDQIYNIRYPNILKIRIRIRLYICSRTDEWFRRIGWASRVSWFFAHP